MLIIFFFVLLVLLFHCVFCGNGDSYAVKMSPNSFSTSQIKAFNRWQDIDLHGLNHD